MSFANAFLVFLLLLGLSSPAYGQANATGRIFGRVDSEAGPLPGVIAVAASPNLQQPLEVTTSPNGDYTMPFLPAGDYTVTFALDGFRTTTETLRLAVGDTVTINVRMQIGIEESVTVQGDLDDGLLSSTPTVAMNYSAELVNQTGSPEAVTRLRTGSPEAVTRLRLPQNGACGFPALRSSQTDSQHSECLQLPMRET